MYKTIIRLILFILPCCSLHAQKFNFNWDWKFHKGDIQGQEPWDINFNDQGWIGVVVPHNPPFDMEKPDPLRPTWESGYSYEGISWYRKAFYVESIYTNKKIFLEFEAINTVADIWVNGVHLTTHEGGYLPFSVDLSDVVNFGDSINILAVKADNSDNPEIPIGNSGWFNWGGIYRDVYLVVKDRLHITNPLYANLPANGGIFISYPAVGTSSATVLIKTHILNEYPSEAKNCTLVSGIYDKNGTLVKEISTTETINSLSDYTFQQSSTIMNPHLWHPDHPNLYTLISNVVIGIDTVDTEITTFGIRSVRFSKENGFELNGKVFRFRGANRMQDFPYIGYAMPNSGQERDIRLLKEAGFQYLRLSQYPQDPSVLNACDRYGIMVLAPIPGFHHIGSDHFKQVSYQNMRDLIRRDRNHPSVIAWELSLNETWWTDPEYSPTAHSIGHEEYPGDQCYVAGWKDDHIYDIYIATPNAGAREYNGSKPLIISEHGHWQFGGANSTSDVNRKEGELKMLRQELNHRYSHSLNLALQNMCGDGLWAGIDLAQYPSGVLDNLRLPKFSYFFWQSQRDPEIIHPDIDSGPMVFIANYWTEQSPGDVKVYSNCDEVELYLNDILVDRRTPDGGQTNANIQHPPFTFSQVKWAPGELKTIGYIDGVEKAGYSVNTPGKPADIEIIIDTLGYNMKQGIHNILFIYARVVDEQGTLVPDANNTIKFSVHGPGLPVSPAKIQTEAGIATFFVRTGHEPGIIIICAETKVADSLISGFVSIEVNPQPKKVIASPVLSVAAENNIYSGSEDGKKIHTRLWGDQFVTNLHTTNWLLTNLPEDVEIDTLERIDSVNVIIMLKGNSTGTIDEDIRNIKLEIASDEFVYTDTGSLYSLQDITIKASKEKLVFVTLKVDMTGITFNDGVYINGEITDDWSFERLHYEGNNIYSITYLLEPGYTTSYSYYTGTSWEESEKEPIPSECAERWGTHRFIIVPEYDTVIGYTYGTCLPPGHSSANKSPCKIFSSDIILYPNPADNQLVVETSKIAELITVHDILGTIRYSLNNLNTNSLIINTSDWEKGFYILTAYFPDSGKLSRIVIK